MNKLRCRNQCGRVECFLQPKATLHLKGRSPQIPTSPYPPSLTPHISLSSLPSNTSPYPPSFTPHISLSSLPYTTHILTLRPSHHTSPSLTQNTSFPPSPVAVSPSARSTLTSLSTSPHHHYQPRGHHHQRPSVAPGVSRTSEGTPARPGSHLPGDLPAPLAADLSGVPVPLTRPLINAARLLPQNLCQGSPLPLPSPADNNHRLNAIGSVHKKRTGG